MRNYSVFINRFISKYENYATNSLINIKNKFANSWQKKEADQTIQPLFLWAHQDLNLGPPDYESGALTV